MGRYWYDDWRRYVPLAERRRRAAMKLAKIRKSGRQVSPIDVAGRKIAATFWGEAWCKNLESYSDYSNRLPRGRTYLRRGSVIDLWIEAGRARSLVSGSDIYEVGIEIKPLGKRRWTVIKGRCAGQIDSLIELLQGSIKKGVMEIVTRKGEGLFPSPSEISLSCSCPDWAIMCKHVAATLYGVGARLDHEPELLFTLRGVDPVEMVEAAVDRPATLGESRSRRVLPSEGLSSVFGVDIDMGGVSNDLAPKVEKTRRAGHSRKKPAERSSPTRKSTGRAGASKKWTKKAALAKNPTKTGSTRQKREAKARKATPKKQATPRNPAAKRKTATAKKAAVVEGGAPPVRPSEPKASGPRKK